MQAKGSTCEIRTKKKKPTSKRISAVSSGLLILFHILISKQSSKPSDRLVRHSSADLCLALYTTGAHHATPKMSIKKKSLNGFNHQILVFENLFFFLARVFAGCARPDDSAKRIRESLERLLECII